MAREIHVPRDVADRTTEAYLHRYGDESSLLVLSRGQKRVVATIMTFAVLIVGLSFLPFLAKVGVELPTINTHAIGLGSLAVGIIVAATGFYLIVTAFKSALTWKSISSGVVTFTPEELDAPDDDLPLITYFIPLFKEGRDVLVRPLASHRRLNYPSDKLEFIFLLEANDTETIDVVRSFGLPDHYILLIVEKSVPQTKPKACNVGMMYAHGDIIAILDAEDEPEPEQARKAATAFAKADPQVACVQGQLVFRPYKTWKPIKALLTKCDAGGYATYFSSILPALAAWGLPVPLGGTSNYFRAETLREVCGWDPFNVTEDLNLGAWLSRKGYTVRVMDSVTLEEPNPYLWNWVKQRTRWKKGYLHTLLVHTRHPICATREFGLWGYLTFLMMVGGTTLTLLLNPVFWGLTASYLTARQLDLESIQFTIESLYPTPVLYVGTILLTAGNIAFVLYGMIGAIRKDQDGSAKWMLLSPIIWAMMSIATWRALIQLAVAPHKWEKTMHGHVTAPVLKVQTKQLGD